MKKLTEKQKKFADLRAVGETLRGAYIGAGYSDRGTEKTLRQNADVLEKRSAASPAIMARIEELRRAAEHGAILKREERQALLTEIATDAGQNTGDRLKAVDQLNRMSGDYTDKIQTETRAAVTMTYAERWETMRAAMGNDDETTPGATPDGGNE